MPRTKEREKIIHQPSTHEIFNCLSSMPQWAALLVEHGTPKGYTPFLQWLLDKNFYNDREEKIAIKKMATDFQSDTTKVTRWLHEIYEDILELNSDRPPLFTKKKLPVTFYFRHYDSSATIQLGIDVLPRAYEHFTFYFIKAKVGADRFWVSRIEHEVYETDVHSTVWLEGGILNRYREMAVEEALFKGWIGFTDTWHKASFEIDDIIRSHLKR